MPRLNLSVDGHPELTPQSPRMGMATRRNAGKRFIMWDGEATKDAGYCLFGNSDGDYIRSPNLGTWDLLDFLTNHAHSAFHFGYGFDYDVDNILCDIGRLQLAVLNKIGTVRVKSPEGKEYVIKHIPRKSFEVCTTTHEVDTERGGRTYTRQRSIRIDDVVSFFNSRYDTALANFGIGSKDELYLLEKGKDNRERFQWEDIDEIQEYWAMELALGPRLMDKLRYSLNSAGFFLSNWYGPGAIAKKMYGKNKMLNHKSTEALENEAIHRASLSGYAGGRFERFQFGYYDGPVYIADINSAYPWAISRLPSLQNGRWHHITAPTAELVNQLGSSTLALWRVKFDARVNTGNILFQDFPFPLFQRQRNGNIIFPSQVENWYYTPEVYNLVQRERLASTYDITEAWIFEDDGSRPFEWVNDYYNLRLALQAEGNESQLAFKLGLNSLYGSMAQRIGWDRDTGELPKWHQIEWAGMVTSACRALVWDAACVPGITKTLISIDTDGVISTAPFRNLPNGKGNQLGRWKVEKYTGILYFQSGLYWLRDRDGVWKPPKTRGISRGRVVDIQRGFDALRSADCSLHDTKRQYLGYRHALATKWEDRGKWSDVPVKFSGEYSGTRWHAQPYCRVCAKGIALDEGLHPLTLIEQRDHSMESFPHELPWENPQTTKQAILEAIYESEC